jgi:hypothetical protein
MSLQRIIADVGRDTQNVIRTFLRWRNMTGLDAAELIVRNAKPLGDRSKEALFIRVGF